MPYNPDIHHRRSIRMGGYDYTQPGTYFITLCTKTRECLFGEITDGTMRLNASGQIVADTWQWLAEHYVYVELDAWIVMPNHMHGILFIIDHGRGGSRTTPTQRKPLGRLIGAFKTVSTTKHINNLHGTPALPLWQRNYWEHVIRDEADLQRIQEYIQHNSARWKQDSLHPSRADVTDRLNTIKQASKRSR